MPVTVQTASYTLLDLDMNTKVQFNSASAVNCSVYSFSSAGQNYGRTAGNRVMIQQIGAGQVTVVPLTGTTIHSAAGLKTRAQYSVLYLDSEGSDVWTLSGDSSV